MSKIGRSTIRGLEQAVAYAQGTADESKFKVHVIERKTRIPRTVKDRALPLHPGEFLREDFLIPLEITAQMLAGEIKVPARRIVAIVKERRGLDADLCLRLARFFRVTAEFWMNLQKSFELEAAREDWPRICKEVPMHPNNRKAGALEPRRLARKVV